MSAPMTPNTALIRLRQYGERTSTWSTATYDSGTERALYEIALTLAAEVNQLSNDLTGAFLDRHEEEQDSARLRLALESARRGRRELRARVSRLKFTAALAEEDYRRVVRGASLIESQLRARVAELEALTPAPIQTCRVCGAGYDYGQPCSVCEFKKRMAAETSRVRPSMTADEWNRRYPVGTPVLAYPGTRDDEPLDTVTRSRAWTLGHGAAVVSVEGAAGGIHLTHVDPIGGTA
ncbi:hypothetical protein ACWD6K_31290 [Streptomyces sp. NPDC002431]